MCAGGERYLWLVGAVPPCCYAVCPTRTPTHLLAGEVVRPRRGEAWSVHRYSPQVWR